MSAPGPTDKPCLKSTLVWKRLGDNTVSQTNFWSYSGSAPSAANLATLAGMIAGDAEDGFQTLCDTFTGVVSCTVNDISVSPVVQGEGGSSWVGTRSGAILAPATSLVVNKKVANPYRGGKPKNFLPLGTGGDVADTGLWASAFVTDAEDGYTTFQSEVLGHTIGSTTIEEEVMVSYYSGGSIVVVSPTTGRGRNMPKKRGVNYSTSPPSGSWSPIVLPLGSFAASDVIGSQRKRNRNA